MTLTKMIKRTVPSFLRFSSMSSAGKLDIAVEEWVVERCGVALWSAVSLGIVQKLDRRRGLREPIIYSLQ